MHTGSAPTFGNLLREFRLASSLTQEELAELAGLSAHGIQKLERGVTHPYRDTADRLVRALQLAPEDEAFLRAAVRAVRRRGTVDQTELPGTIPHNLPVPITSLIGREHERDEVIERLTRTRILTLTGVGGCGKTRLAIEVGRGVLENFPDGVWLVELGALVDPNLVGHTVATIVGVRGIAGQLVTPGLLASLRIRLTLLILDNCEHLLDSCSRLVDNVVRSCPDVRVLATSREPLGIGGEVVWRVPSLPLPDTAHLPPLTELERIASVRLFVERARAVESHFALTARNAPAVAQVCCRLDGLPLALELAAARVRALTVDQIVTRLDQRFRLLAGGSRSAVPRHQTLAATLDWSYDLLDEPERALLCRVAVFAGSFTLDAAEAVGAGEPIQANAVLDVLTSLVDKSLVVARAAGSEERYTLLETIRHFAEGRLVQSGEAAQVRDRHRDWCMDLARSQSWQSASGRDLLVDEQDNFRAALAWCASDDASSTAGLDLLGFIGRDWGDAVGLHEARLWLETFLAKAPAPTVSRANALLAHCHAVRLLHEFALAERGSEEALGIYRELGDEPGIAHALASLGLGAANRGNYALGLRLLEEALTSGAARGENGVRARHLRDVGVVCIAAGDFQRARSELTESIRIAQDGSMDMSLGLWRLAILDRLEGDYASARTRLGDARGHPDQSDGPFASVTIHRLALANLARAEGRFEEALGSIAGLLRDLRPRAEFGLLEAIAMVGICHIAAGAHARGVSLIAFAANVEGPIGTVHMPDVRIEAPIHLRFARSALGEAAYTSAWAEGEGMTLDQAVRDAPTLTGAGGTS
jgi:non-specific serine/threonine protein kinase